jgi:hypothetical protein
MEEFGEVCPKEKNGKKKPSKVFKEVPQVCPNKKKGARKGLKEVPFSPCKKKKVKKKGGQIKFKRNPIESPPKKKVPKQSLKFAQTRKESAPRKKGSHPISPPIFCPDPQF